MHSVSTRSRARPPRTLNTRATPQPTRWCGGQPCEAGVGAEPGGLSSQPQLLKVQVVSRDLVDAVRVSQIKQAISEGRFKVKTEVVADRLLQTVRKLIASFRR